MTSQGSSRTVAICETQPVTAEGLKRLIDGCPDLDLSSVVNSLQAAAELTLQAPPELMIVDKAFGIQALLDWISHVREHKICTSLVVWGISITEAEALRFLQAGARGILRKTASGDNVLACLRAVLSGSTWMEDTIFREAARSDRYPRSELTPREQQVLELVEQGLKNKEIGRHLGIRPGTVKIHLKHIFEKTGVRGRYGLALSGLKNRGVDTLVTI